MTLLEILKDYLDRERHNIFCFSASYTMDSPKRGYEREFEEATERADVLAKAIKDLEREEAAP